MTTAFSQVLDKNKAETSTAPSVEIPVSRGYNIASFENSTAGFKLVLTKHIPEQLMARYVHAALKTALPRQLEDNTWFAEITGLNGVWGAGENPHQCLNELREVLVDWLLMKIEHEDRDIPILDGVNLNVIR